MGVPPLDKRNDESTYEKAKTNIKKVSTKMDQEIHNLNTLHSLESDETIKSITTSLQTLQNDIDFSNKNQLEQAWDKFALRTPDGAKAFLRLIKNES